MFDPFLITAIVVAIIGTVYASYSDLKTTEVSDWVPISMGIAGLIVNGIRSLVYWDYSYILFSIVIGLIYLGYGVLMYKLGQWGGADAAILAALGFLIPIYPSFSYFGLSVPYQLALVLNIYLLGAVYALAYAFVLAFRNQHVFSKFNSDLIENKMKIALYLSAIVGVMVLSSGTVSYLLKDISIFYSSIINQLFLLPLFGFMLVYWRFAKTIEENVFKQKISTKDLKEGDMIAEDINLPGLKINSRFLEGLTIEQVKTIKKHKKSITIKEGIRFIPAFLLGLIFTLLGIYF